MSLDSGMDTDMDEVTTEPPTPEFMEGVNVWLWDDEGRVALPRVGVDAIGSSWEEAHRFSVNIALPGGAVLATRGSGTPHAALDDQGRPRVRGAGPLRLECLEPFRMWRASFDGEAESTTIEEQMATRWGAARTIRPARVPVSFQLDLEMKVAPFVAGAHEPEGHVLTTEHRFEQLCAAQGEVTINGSTIGLRGGGLRVKRRGTMTRSDYSDWMGHVWMSALFPSGRAFGIDNFHPHPDGTPRYHEGWLLDHGRTLSAKFEATPWKTDWIAEGEDVSFTLLSAAGSSRITARTVMTTVGAVVQLPDGRSAFPAVQQGIVACEWDGEQAYGMIERSSQAENPPLGV